MAGRLGDNIDADFIYPGQYLNVTDRDMTAAHLIELAYPEIRGKLRPSDFVLAGKNVAVARVASRPRPPPSCRRRHGHRGLLRAHLLPRLAARAGARTPGRRLAPRSPIVRMR